MATVRLATETQSGRFALVETSAPLALSFGVNTLAVTATAETQQAVLHVALSACLFGVSDSRLMIVPKGSLTETSTRAFPRLQPNPVRMHRRSWSRAHPRI